MASVVVGIGAAAAVGEAVARVVVARTWAPEKVTAYTTRTDVRGPYTAHAELTYVLTPGYAANPQQRHNRAGFKGSELVVGKRRVAAVGASTTYGPYVAWNETYAARLEAMLLRWGVNAEVINAGVPGYVSTDSLLNLRLRVLPLEPELVVIYQGRNEVFPQAFTDFRPDYTHYRRPDWTFDRHWLHKYVFSFSHLAMVMATQGSGRFGWSEAVENPLYASIALENRPSTAELIRNLDDPSRTSAYRRTLVAMIDSSRQAGSRVLLATMAVRADRFATGVLELPPRDDPAHDPAIYDALQRQVDENNRIVREVAAEHGLAVAETAALAGIPELFLDDCHMNAEGHARRAALLLSAIDRHDLIRRPQSRR